MKPTQIYLDEKVIKGLKHRAVDLNISMAELIRRMLKLQLTPRCTTREYCSFKRDLSQFLEETTENEIC